MANELRLAIVNTITKAFLAKGWKHRRIARELGVNRETVGRYARLQREAGSKPPTRPPAQRVHPLQTRPTRPPGFQLDPPVFASLSGMRPASKTRPESRRCPNLGRIWFKMDLMGLTPRSNDSSGIFVPHKSFRFRRMECSPEKTCRSISAPEPGLSSTARSAGLISSGSY